jgi:hypothetical protein
MAQKFRKALELVSKDDGLTEADHAHLARWGADGYPEDPLWEKLATDAQARGMLPPNTIYRDIIGEALIMRRHAESVSSGTDFELRERQRRREHLLELAKKADDLAEYYKWAAEYSGIASYFMRFLKPVSELQELHEKEAKLLRQRAGRQPKPAARVSRQDRSKGRKGLRKIIAFIDLSDCFLRDWLSEKPDYEAVAVLTEIAFPDHDINAEYVRQVLRPTTVVGRSKSRALARPKSR